jgi:hypothetical protein
MLPNDSRVSFKSFHFKPPFYVFTFDFLSWVKETYKKFPSKWERIERIPTNSLLVGLQAYMSNYCDHESYHDAIL